MEDLKTKLSQMMFRIRKLTMDAPPRCDLHTGEIFSLLKIARQNGESSQNVLHSELQRHMFVSKSAVSQILSGLESKGYISREIDPDDRRKFRLKITDSGIEKLEEMRGRTESILDEIIIRFGEEKTKELLSLVSGFLDVFEEIKLSIRTEGR